MKNYIPTESETGIYLQKKRDLEETIGWYSQTIAAIEIQQEGRRQVLRELQEKLFELENRYWNE